jgi:hypothetical protein
MSATVTKERKSVTACAAMGVQSRVAGFVSGMVGMAAGVGCAVTGWFYLREEPKASRAETDVPGFCRRGRSVCILDFWILK